MPKFHISSNGSPNICKATTMACPIGGAEDHFDGNLKDANKWVEEKNAEMYGGNFSKTHSGPVEEFGIVNNINTEYPLPQANDLEKISTVVDAVAKEVQGEEALSETVRDDKSRTNNPKSLKRQGRYYADAAGYLGLVEHNENRDYSLTRLGEEFADANDAEKVQLLKEITDNIPAMAVYRSNGRGTKGTEEAIAFAVDENPDLDEDTVRRRISSFVTWDKKLQDAGFSDVISREKATSGDKIANAIAVDEKRREQRRKEREEAAKKEAELSGAQKATEFSCKSCFMIRPESMNTGGNICVECD